MRHVGVWAAALARCSVSLRCDTRTHLPSLPTFAPVHHFVLQRGIDLPSLDPSYFTSLSYYFLLLFGLRGVMTLLFRWACA